MTPKEKAQELVEKYCKILFGDEQFVNIKHPRQCALICVKEILKSFPYAPRTKKMDIIRDYWHDVKKEIESM